MHDVLRYLLQCAALPATVIELLLLATTKATVHMGGHEGVTEALAPLLASVAHGCPAPAILHCGGAPHFSRVPLCSPVLGSGGPFDRLG